MSARASGKALRLVKALAAYGLAAAALWLAAEPLRRAFLLPDLFTLVARGFVVLVLPVVIAVAWRYPEVGRRVPASPESE